MTSPPKRPSKPLSSGKQPEKPASSSDSSGHITRQILTTLRDLKNDEGLRAYPIRLMVTHAEHFGPYLRQQRLETNQVRKFLDALNRIKVKLSQDETLTPSLSSSPQQTTPLAALETDIVLLKPKLAYAAARQKAAKPLSEVMATAIDKVHCVEDFQRLVQFIESIIAYHKAEGGK